MGGAWERMVRSVKTILKSLLKEQLVKDEALSTLTTEVERILNERPLTSASDDPNYLEPLTPNMLLLQRSNSCMPPGVCDENIMRSRRWFMQAQYLAKVFWRRWSLEYLPNLQSRQKWLKPQRNFKEGDLVLVMDEHLPRGQWPLGRVIETNRAASGLVRSLKVSTGTKIKERPVTKICLLEEDATGSQEEESLETEGNEEDVIEIDGVDQRNTRPTRKVQRPERFKDYV